jgi:hypothetical protein
VNVGALKRAAVDAWMFDLTSSVIPGWFYETRRGDVYVVTYESTMVRVRAPDASTGGGGGMEPTFVPGELGDDGYWVPDPGFADIFASIQARIDDLLARFADIPVISSGDHFMFYMEQLAQIAEMIRPPGTTRDGTELAPPPNDRTSLYPNVKEIERQLGNVCANSLNSFRTYFLGMMEEVLWSYYQAIVVLGAALGGERNLWTDVADNLETVVDTAAAAFSSHSQYQAVDWRSVAVAVDAMATGIGAFTAVAPEIAPVVAAIAGIGWFLDLAAAVEPTPGPPPDVRSFEQIMIAFQNDLAGVADNIVQQETNLSDSLRNNVGTVGGSAWTVSNHLGSRQNDDGHIDDPGSVSAIVIENDALKQIYQHDLPDVANKLQSAASLLDSLTDASFWYRDERLGSGDKGSWRAWDDFRWAVLELLKNLSWEADTAAQALNDLDAQFEEGDAAGASAYQSVMDQIDGGSPYSPSLQDPTVPNIVPPYRAHTSGGIGGY